MKELQGIPLVGLGLWEVKDEESFKAAFTAALSAGYRHFDGAQAYGNEQLIGEAWKSSGKKREELFITTKIHIKNFGYTRALKSFEESLMKLQTEYVDLLLLHFPVTGLRKRSWMALEELHAAGKARRIGVSNFTIRHLEEMKNYAKIMPTVNQVELHVFLQQPKLLKYCKDHDIIVEAYSPLAHAKEMEDETIRALAAKHGKSYAQIMLRWCIQKDVIVLPKSVTPSRIEENIDIFDFSLSAGDMKQLEGLERDLRTCWNPTLVP